MAQGVRFRIPASPLGPAIAVTVFDILAELVLGSWLLYHSFQKVQKKNNDDDNGYQIKQGQNLGNNCPGAEFHGLFLKNGYEVIGA
jgi:hypothetical protein